MAKKKQTAKSKTSKKISFSFSWAGLFFTGFSIFLALVWAFILGVIVGRGYEPGTLLPGIKGYIKQENSRSAQARTKPKEEVLQAEELGFYEALKKGEKAKNEIKKNTAQSRERAKEKAKKVKAEKVKKDQDAAEEAPDYKVYAYLYQVAAFKEQGKAKSLLDKMKSVQIDGYVKEAEVKDTKWFRVYVNFQGTMQEVQGLKSKLNKLGISHPFVRSKRRIM